MRKTLTIEMQLRVPIKFKVYKRYVVASCPALDVCSQGDSIESAKGALGEALAAFLTSCLERGVLGDVLKNCGFKAVPKPKKHTVKPLATREDYLNIPLHLLSEQGNDNHCHA
ncbi:MAG: type II toxin-antitoxin system HicB family antitoxin [Desulfobacterales bacterium]